MIYFEARPILFELGFLQVRYYSLMYIIGLIIAYFLIPYVAKKRGIAISQDRLAEDLLIIFVGILLFSRIFYVLIYGLESFLQNPLFFFQVWKGGMSFHGGLAGATLGGLIVAKRHKKSFLRLADIFVLPVPIALALGRIGNLMNGELFGRVTNVPWAFRFSTDPALLPRHPSQLYSVAKNLIIFFILWKLYHSDCKAAKKEGFVFLSFIFLYGVFRFIVEFFRQPEIELSLGIVTLTAGQVLSLVMVAASLPLLIKLWKASWKPSGSGKKPSQ
jgi:phosphatidylglycerol:prolipoprotein diacylglycerol transferase